MELGDRIKYTMAFINGIDIRLHYGIDQWDYYTMEARGKMPTMGSSDTVLNGMESSEDGLRKPVLPYKITMSNAYHLRGWLIIGQR